jgi:hypothetical protein
MDQFPSTQYLDSSSAGVGVEICHGGGAGSLIIRGSVDSTSKQSVPTGRAGQTPRPSWDARPGHSHRRTNHGETATVVSEAARGSHHHLMPRSAGAPDQTRRLLRVGHRSRLAARDRLLESGHVHVIAARSGRTTPSAVGVSRSPWWCSNSWSLRTTPRPRSGVMRY